MKKEKKKEKVEKNRKKDSFLYLLNPKYLQREVHAYGYNFSEKAHIGTIGCVVLGAIVIGMLFKLDVLLIISICVLGIIVLPIMILDMYKRMYQQKRFEEAGQYMEQIVRSFQREKKIYSALKECAGEFKDGRMKESIEEALNLMNNSHSNREALEVISKNFDCEKIRSTNDFMLNAEEHGGDFIESANLLIKDNNLWVRRGYALHSEKKQQFIEMLLSIAFCTLLCAGMLYALNYMGSILNSTVGSEFNIFVQPLIQGTSVVFIIFSIFICLRSSNSLTGDWLKVSVIESEKMLLDDYEAVIHYDEKRSMRKSIIMAVPFLIAAVPVCLFVSKIFCMILILCALFLFFQHKIGYNIAMSAVKKHLGTVLPVWFMDLALLLEYNTVYVALEKSYDNADKIIQCELDKLFLEMKEEPGSIEPYYNFCEKFQMPEITSCMKMLYALAENGTGDKKMQLYNLIGSVQDMQVRADEIANERTVFQYRRFFSYPMCVTTIKLAVDCMYGMLLALSFFGSVTTLGG